MNIFKNTVVTLKYSLFDADNKLIEESKEPIVYLHGGYDNIFPKVEAALASKSPGEKVTVTMEPVDAFGEFDESLIRVEETDKFPPSIKVGDQFEGVTEHDDHQHTTVYTITDIAEGKVVADGNHPLAGVRLRFECEVMDVRPATKEEIMHGHVHGEHGHHH
jgi:FKBP-type peptidyl-prolyl cis-trans isomerase SlyD